MAGAPAPAPDEPIDSEQLRIERFRENADVRNFDSGNSDLDCFLTTEEVANYERERVGKTYLVYWQAEGQLLGYFTISSESLRLQYFHSVKGFSKLSEMRVSAVPGIKIGRLAVQTVFKRRQVGTSILKYISGHALATAAAARIIFLEAYPESVPFYDSFGFKVLEHQKLRFRRNKMMYFDLLEHPEYATSRR